MSTELDTNSSYAMEIRNLTKKFGNFTAVDNISFNVRKGEIFGFLGANGAGKTTAMKILCGLSRPTAGEGTVAGFDINNEQEKIKRHIGYMSQKFALYPDLTVRENIRLFGGIYGLTDPEIKAKTNNMLQTLEMEDVRDKLAGELPLGWKQKLSFIDPETRRRFWEMIYEASEKGITVFVTTHYMDEAEYCDRVSIMVDGRIEALDSPAALKTKYKATNMDAVFRTIARKAQREE